MALKSNYTSVSVALPKLFSLKTCYPLLANAYLCPTILEYEHLYPFQDLFRLLSSNPISSNPTLPPPPPPPPPHFPPTDMLSYTQTRTCSLDSLNVDQQSFMLLDYCCRCCGFTLIKRHGPFSLKTTPSDTWVRTLYDVGKKCARIES